MKNIVILSQYIWKHLAPLQSLIRLIFTSFSNHSGTQLAITISAGHAYIKAIMQLIIMNFTDEGILIENMPTCLSLNNM